MSSKKIKIIKAEWDKRVKTKFLKVDGTIEVNSFEDSVKVSIANPQGINENILILNIELISGNGPLKPQPVKFQFEHMTTGTESWTHVQVSYGEESDTMSINILE